jgi:queuine/archaeosine tRNA-ribosyltransferase
MVFTHHGRITLRNARHADDPRPIDEESSSAAAAIIRAPIGIPWSRRAKSPR